MKAIARLWRLAVLSAMLALPGEVQAQDFACSDNFNGTCTITRYHGSGGAVTIPSAIDGLVVASIGNAAFDLCGSLTSVTIPNSVTSIEYLAFGGCTGLTSLTIPSSVTRIGNAAFFDCDNLPGITIPSSVASIGFAPFEHCTSMTAITVDALNPVYSSADGILFDKSQKVLVEYPTGKSGSTYAIPNSVTNIGDSAFASCTFLVNVIIPSSINSIGSYDFNGCNNLVNVTIPDSVVSIGNWAFNSCLSLTNITIPSSVANIADRAFQDCYYLKGVYFCGNAPNLGGSNVFSADSAATVYYPQGTTGWGSTFGGLPTALWTPPPDTTPPGNVTAFSATPCPGQVMLAWLNPTDTDFAGVRIQRKSGGYPSNPDDGTTIYNGSGTNTTDAGLNNGTTYYYTAFSYDRSTNYAGGSMASATPQPDTTPPANVGGFSATTGNAQITLRWTNPTDLDFAGVKILRKTESYPSGTTDGTTVYNSKGTSIIDTGLVNGTEYYYKAFSYDTATNFASGFAATATPQAPDTTPPANITGFTGASGHAQIVLCWTNPTDSDFAGVKILRTTGTYPTNTTDGKTIYNSSGTNAIDSGLSNGITYYYTAFSYDRATNYASGATTCATPQPDTTPPGNVTGFSAAPWNGHIVLLWTNPTDADFAGVKVLRKTGSYPSGTTDGTTIYNGTGTGTTDTGVSNGVTYYYTAFSYDLSTNYASGATACATAQPDTTPPGNVAGFLASPGNGKIVLSWANPIDADFAGARIQRKIGGYPTSTTDGTTIYNGSGTIFTDTGLSNGVTYYYVGFSYDLSTNYAGGATASATPYIPDTTPPANISGFTATGGNAQVYLRWKNPTDSDFAGVMILRKTGGFPLGLGDSTMVYNSNGTSTIDTGLVNGTTYYYKAFSYDLSTNGASGVTATATPTATAILDTTPPANISGFTATGGNAQVSLRWTNPTDSDFAGVKIQRKTGGYPSSPTDGTTVYDDSGTSMTDIGLTNGTPDFYKAFSYDSSLNYATGVTATATPQFPWSCATNNGKLTIIRYTGSEGAVVIPSTINGLPVTSIGSTAFQSCTSVTNITIPSGVTNIGNSAFYGCTNLASVIIPNGLISIGSSAFFRCKLTCITIPGSVTSIGQYAFWNCTSLTAVYCRGNAPSIGSSLFMNDTNGTICVYYLPGTTGWETTLGTSPTEPTVLWKPKVQGDANFGVLAKKFGFDINWASGAVAIVEACTNLTNPVWCPLVTNALTSDSAYFSDPACTNYQRRFYRIRSP